MKVWFALVVLCVTAIPASAQVRLPVAGVDAPVPRLVAAPPEPGTRPYSNELGWRPGLGNVEDPRFAEGILGIVEFVVRADGRTEAVTFLASSAWAVATGDEIRRRVYEPVVLHGEPQPVLMVEFVQRVFSEAKLAGDLISIAGNPRLPIHARLMAIADLPALSSLPSIRDRVTSALSSLRTDSNDVVRRAAADAASDARRATPVAGIDVPRPRRIGFTNPGYPPLAYGARLQGVILVSIVVGPSGRPLSVVPVVPTPELDEAAIEAFYQWRYEPTLVAGRATNVRLTEAVSFFIDEAGIYNWSSKAATDTKLPRPVRLAAIESLYSLVAAKRVAVRDILDALTTDDDVVVAAEVTKRLKQMNAVGPLRR
jgi:TonB family protein